MFLLVVLKFLNNTYVSTHCSMGIFNMHKFFLAMFLHIVQWAYLTCIYDFGYVSIHCSMAIFNRHFFFGYVSTHGSMAIFTMHIFFGLCFYTLFNGHI